MLHLDTIDRLTLLCPIREGRLPADWLGCSNRNLTISGIEPLSYRTVLRLPQVIAHLWNVIGQHDIVHTGVAGWPFPLGWIAVPIAKIRQRFLVIVVESSFWRVVPGKPSLSKRIKARLFEAANRMCVGLASAAFFTTEAYAEELGYRARKFSAVLPATWIDAETILSPAVIGVNADKRQPRLLYVGRLTPAKGVDVLLSAIAHSDVAVDIMGEGELLEPCHDMAKRFPTRVRVLPLVPYGQTFFETLDGYRAIIVPTLSDEQPRVIADAFARGVPVIGSATSGNRVFVAHEHSGWLVSPGDAEHLAQTMMTVLADPTLSLSYGLNARERISLHTHKGMHERRALDIDREFKTRSMKRLAVTGKRTASAEA